MKGLKYTVALGVRIGVILAVILIGTVVDTKAVTLGEFGMVEVPSVGPVDLTDVPQNIVTLTVTPRVTGYLLFIADIDGSLEQLETGSTTDAATFTVCLTPTSGGGLEPGVTPCQTPSVFAGAPISMNTHTSILFPVSVKANKPVTYYVTAYLLAPATGTCTVKAGLSAILLPGALQIQ